MFWYWFSDLYCIAEPDEVGRNLVGHPTVRLYEEKFGGKTNSKLMNRWESRGFDDGL